MRIEKFTGDSALLILKNQINKGGWKRVKDLGGALLPLAVAAQRETAAAAKGDFKI